jgi:2-iminobutanoate/2-iminopropanoate deaminase
MAAGPQTDLSNSKDFTMTTITRVMTSNPAEHQNCYSRITKADRWVYSSTTAGKNYVTGVLPDDVIGQTRQAFANIEQALSAVGAELIDTVRVDICLADGRDIGAVLQEVNRLVGDTKPSHFFTVCQWPNKALKVEIALILYMRNRNEAKDELLHVELQ